MAVDVAVLIPTLLAASFWGLSPIPAKRGLSDDGSSIEAAVTLVTVGVLLFWIATVYQHGLTEPTSGLTAFGIGVFLAGGFVGTTVGRLANYTGIDRVGASVNSGVIQTNPLFATILAVTFLGEPLRLPEAVGIVVLVGGLVLLGVSRGGDRHGWRVSDLAFPLTAAIAYGSGSVIRRFGLTTTHATPLQAATVNETAAFLGIVGFALVARRERLFAASRRTYGYFLVGGVLNALGLLSLFAALDVGRVVVVVPLASVSTLITVTFTHVFLRDVEAVTTRVVAGALVVVAGVVLVTSA